MNALALYSPSRSGLWRWGLCALLVVGIHGALIAAGVLFAPPPPDAPGTASQPIMLDLESAPPTPEPPVDNVAPGPTMQEAEPPAPEPEKQEEAQKEEIPPTPVQEAPEVVAPPEKPKEEPKPEPEKPKPKPVIQKKPKKPTDTPAPRTTAPQRASQAAMSSYKGLVSAHIARFKQYPSGAKSAGEQGTAVVTFTVTRGGGATGIRISKSSGHPSLDAEAIGVVRRAQPLPAPPADIPASSLLFVMPYRFTIH
jgi:periplasmic protein TonB